MPALIGGFGKINTIITKRYMSSNNEELRTSNDNPFNTQESKTPMKLGNGEYTNKNGVDPFYITGFTDAEGCFHLDMSNTRSKNWSAAAVFQINLHIADIDMLYKIQAFFGGIGSVTVSGHTARYRVSKIKDILSVIIPHFEKYPLQSAKSIDFQIWKESAVLINNKEHLTEKGILKIVYLKSGLNKGLSDNLKAAFPSVPELDMSKYKINSGSSLNPNWISGFIDGDGSFTVLIDSKTNYVNLRLIIGLNQRESFLIKKISLPTFFGGVGRINYSTDKQVVYFTIGNIKDLNDW
jgi:hypothetical protein